MGVEKESGVGVRRGRRTRLNSSTRPADLALKMPRCQVMLQIINVERLMAEQRVHEVVYHGKRAHEQDDGEEVVLAKKHAKSVTTDYEISELEEQTALSRRSDQDEVNVNLLEKSGEVKEGNEDQIDTADKEGRVTRQRMKLTGKSDFKQSDVTHLNASSSKTPVVALKSSQSSSRCKLTSLERERRSGTIKYKSAKTGRVFEKHPCNICDKVFSSSVGLKIHLTTHMYECKVCHVVFSTSKELETHTEKHITSIITTEAQMQCTVCGKEFSTQKLLRKHTETKNIHARPFSCSLDTCERTFTRRVHLLNHRYVHPDNRELECEKCAMRFSSEFSLVRHQKIPNCGKSLNFPVSNSEKKFECLDCEKCFSKIEYLEMHKDYHWEDLTNCIPCRLNTCKLTFTSKNKLERHMEEHTNMIRDGMFLCTKDNCQERFRDTSLMKKHLENHSTVEKCRICGLFFASKWDMMLHRIVCMHEKKQTQNFPCSFCGKIFKAKRFLNNHVKLCGKSEAIVSSDDKKLPVCSIHEAEVTLTESVSTILEGAGAVCSNVNSLSPPASSNNHKSFNQDLINDTKFFDDVATNVDSIKLAADSKSAGQLTELLPAEKEDQLVHNSKDSATIIDFVVSKDPSDTKFVMDNDKKDPSLPSSPKLDNDLLDPFTPGSSIGPPLASSGVKVDYPVDISSSQDSVVIVEISEEGSSSLEIAPPVTGEKADEENNVLPEVLFSEEDVIIEEVVEEIVESNTDKKDKHSLDLVECFDSRVVFDMDMIKNDDAVLDVLVEHDKSRDENSNLNQFQPVNPDIRKAALLSVYSSVVTANTCPVMGDFIKALKISQDMLWRLAIPNILEPVDGSSNLCRGLAIDLLDLQHKSMVSQEVLASFVSKLLPVSERPTLPDAGLVEHMMVMLTKMKVQASRFRVKYSSFPRYLDKYLVELCNPFI